MRAMVQQAERAARKHEVAADKLRARLADDMAAQERKAKRNADAYARAKRTLAVSKGHLLQREAPASVLTCCHQLSHCTQPVSFVSAHIAGPGTVVSHESESQLLGCCCAGNPKARITAGTMSAAMRELRPVEIVCLYEDVTESLEVRLSVSHMMGGRHVVMLMLVLM